MASPQFSNWFMVRDGAEIPAAHLPAAYWQYRWVISTDFTIPPSWFGLSGGIMRLEFELAIGDQFSSSDRINYICVTLRDLFIGSLLAFYTYYPGALEMSGALDYPTWGSNQPWWQYDGDSSGASLPDGFIRGWFHSPIYKVGLPVGSGVDIVRFYPSTEIMGGVLLQMRTARGAVGKKKMLVDPVTSDRHLPRTEDGMLLLRTRIHDGRLTGVQSGLAVATGAITGGNIAVTVQPGTAVVGFEDCALGAAVTLPVPISGSYYVCLTPDPSPSGSGELAATAQAWPVSYPGIVLGRLKSGLLQSANGVLIADGVSEGQYAPGRTEDGRMMMTYDTATARDVTRVSRDRGVTWEDE